MALSVRSWGVPLREKPDFLEDFHAFLHGPTPEELGSSATRKTCHR